VGEDQCSAELADLLDDMCSKSLIARARWTPGGTHSAQEHFRL